MYEDKKIELALNEKTITDILAEKEWSWSDLARYAGLSRNTLRRHFNGNGITVDTISKIAWALQVDIQDIITLRSKR